MDMMHHVVMHMMSPMMFAAALGLCGNSLGAIRIRFRTRRCRINLRG
jgi:hypothetical protein